MLIVSLGALAMPAEAATVCRVLRGNVTLPAQAFDGGDGVQVVTVALPSVDASRSVLWFSSRCGSGDVSDTRVRGELSSSALTFTRGGGQATATVLWTVAEFCSGVAVQRGLTRAGTDALLAVATYEPTKSLVLATANAGYADYNTDRDNYVLAMPEDAVTLRIQHGQPFVELDAAWQLVQSDGLDVRRVRAAMNEGTAQVQALSGTPADAFARVTWRGVGPAVSEGESYLVTATNSGGQVVVERGFDAGAVDVDVEAVRFTDGTRVQAGRAVLGNGFFLQSVTLPSPVDPARSVAFLSGHEQYGRVTGGSVTAAAITTRLVDGQTLELERASSGVEAVADWVVLEFVGLDGGTPVVPDGGVTPADGGNSTTPDAGPATLVFLGEPPGMASCNTPWTYTPTVQAPGRVAFSVRAPDGGEVPTGLFVNSDTGALLLRTPAAGTYRFELVATSNGQTATQAITVEVTCAPLAVGCGCDAGGALGSLAVVLAGWALRRRRSVRRRG